MRNIALIISFNGAHYHGFQIQKNAVTVEGTLYRAARSILGGTPLITGCSRTDAGVHADEFCVCIKTESSIPCGSLLRAFNTNLPCDIAVRYCADMPEDFHAQYSCSSKTYIYRIINSHIKNPFMADTALLFRYPIDADLIDREAKDFIGTHDFASFCASGGTAKTTVRTVYDASAVRDNEMITVSVTGNGFLYNMVRIMVGTLIYISQGKLPAGSIPGIIAAKDRSAAGITVGPQGLYLHKVRYDGWDFPPANAFFTSGGSSWVK